MNYKDVKKIIISLTGRLKLKKERAAGERRLTNPHRDWAVVLTVFAAVNVLSAFFGAYLFLQISKGEIFLVEPERADRSFSVDRTLLSETLFFYEEKERLHETLSTSPPTLADPSQ